MLDAKSLEAWVIPNAVPSHRLTSDLRASSWTSDTVSASKPTKQRPPPCPRTPVRDVEMLQLLGGLIQCPVQPDSAALQVVVFLHQARRQLRSRLLWHLSLPVP